MEDIYIQEGKKLDKAKKVARKIFIGLTPEEIKEKFAVRVAKKKYSIEVKKGYKINYSDAKLFTHATTRKDSHTIDYELSLVFSFTKPNGKQSFFDRSVFIYNRFGTMQEAVSFQNKHGKDLLKIFKTTKADKKPKKSKSVNESMEELGINEDFEDKLFEYLEGVTEQILSEENKEENDNKKELDSLEESLDKEFSL